jgi:two-component system, NarL family, response regulator NreC
MVAEGKSIKEIALLLHLSPKTTDAHRRNLMTKLGTASVAALIKYAIREGVTSLDF